MNFSQRLNDIMISRNITNYEMSKKTGVSDSLIGYWRKGERIPKADNLIIIANFLEVSTDYLLGRTDNPNETEMPTGDNNIIIGRDNSGTATVNSSPEIALGEMETELLKAFQSLPFTDKIDVLNYIINKAG